MKKAAKVTPFSFAGLLSLPVLIITIIVFILAVIVAVILMSLLVLFLSILLTDSSPTPQETIGDYQCTAHCAYYVFQDGITYKEYQYSNASFEENPYFEPVTQENKQNVLMFVHDYERWVEGMADDPIPEAQELYQSYRYTPASLSEDDYYYVDIQYPDRPLANYEIFIFDSETMTLYCLKSWI